MRPRQGEVWWADLPAPAGRRPVLVLTRTSAIRQLTNVTVAPLTRTIRYLETEVVLSPHDGMPSLCAVSLDNILTVPQGTLDARLATLPAGTMRMVFEAIHVAFAMPND